MTESTSSNPLLERLRRHELSLMMAIRSARTPEIVRIAKSTGHHAVMVDLEHSAMSLDVAGQMCAAACDLGITALVRVPERDYGSIGRLLDSGASGIIAPRIETAAEAGTIARACRFPPHGHRSQLAMVPQLGMKPTPAREMNPRLDAGIIVQILLETPAGIANADAIAAVPGVDMIAFGANDFTAELGIPGEYADPRVRAAIATAAEACREHGKLLMVGGIGDLAMVKSLVPLGVCQLHLTGTDTDMVYSAAEQRVKRLADWHTQTKA